ncbi:hypothetical protein ACF0H5_013882 [Mactra antiquata]
MEPDLQSSLLKPYYTAFRTTLAIVYDYKVKQFKYKSSKMIPKLMVSCMVIVLIVTLGMTFTVFQGHFKKVKVENDDEHYAEQVYEKWKTFLPKFLKMPFNTVVNVGYVIVGAAWCAITSVALDNKKITISDATLFYMFNLASCCYGPIQAIRILTRMHNFGVLDQWYTLPFFMWVFLWGTVISRGWNSLRIIVFMTVSVSSYIFTLYSDIGFEICLSIHICFAITGGVLSWLKVPNANCKKPFVSALICCTGFVVIKLLDLELVKVHDIFRYISGHFISKIFDVLQIHYTNQFFYAVVTASISYQKKKAE